jgi:hypothetical protein
VQPSKAKKRLNFINPFKSMRTLLVLIFVLAPLLLFAQGKKVETLVPETYELSNVILALTQYGKSDQWEVQKNTDYYKAVISFFEPVKDHPLLDSVNYSREKWEDYLSFRTDAFAFSFSGDGRLMRNVNFYAVPGHQPFDTHLDLINDFVAKSNFRQFFTSNKEFYQRLIQNYSQYYFVNEAMKFLDEQIGSKPNSNASSKYLIVLSPLVYRMNCHREIDANTTADFPSATEEFINEVKTDDLNSRIEGSHLIFTEMDHGYVNPISEKHKELIAANFDLKKWDKNSGYPGINCFNEYMTWAVYDLFVKKHFPENADSIITQWQYQNASRGFIAQNLFAEKVSQLYSKNKSKDFESLYVPLLKWCKSIESNIAQPTILNTDGKTFLKISGNKIHIEFSEPMNSKLPFSVELEEFKNEKPTKQSKIVYVKNFKWSNQNKTLEFVLETDFTEYAVVFNWWGISKPLVSEQGIHLKPQAYILVKK